MPKVDNKIKTETSGRFLHNAPPSKFSKTISSTIVLLKQVNSSIFIAPFQRENASHKTFCTTNVAISSVSTEIHQLKAFILLSPYLMLLASKVESSKASSEPTATTISGAISFKLGNISIITILLCFR
jgi:hypothetical protein